MTKKLLTLENIRSGAVPSDAVAVGFLLGEVERLQKQMEILQRANRFLSEQIPSALEPCEQPRISERDYTDAAMHAGLPPPTQRDIQAMNAVIDALYKNRVGASRDASSDDRVSIECPQCFGDKRISMSDGSSRRCEYCSGTGRAILKSK